MTIPSTTKPDIGIEIEKFVHAIDALRQTFVVSTQALVEADKVAHKNYDEFLEKNAEFKDSNGKKLFRIKSHDYCNDFKLLRKELDRIHVGFAVVPRSFFVALVSQYDAYLGNLIEALYYLRPELLQSSDCKLTFGELSTFGTIENARRFIVEKDVETVLRKSHIEQFDWLEKKFNLKLRGDLPVWSTFVELTERRNLCVHTDAVVSTQYVSNCQHHGVDLKDVEVGKQLHVSNQYFFRAYRAIYEIGLKLGQVLWRKVIPHQVEAADKSLLHICFSLLQEERYNLAGILLTFADTTLQKHHSNDWYRLVFRVNRALAAYLRKDSKECLEILASQDWSAASNEFKLGEFILREQFDSAATMMLKIGAQGYPQKADYLHWPLFLEFRKTEQFSVTFKQR